MVESATTERGLYRTTELLVRRWEDEGVIFDTFSGNTYLVDKMAANILAHLENTAHTQDEIIGYCADLLGYELDANFCSHVVSVLNHLAGLKLLYCE